MLQRTDGDEVHQGAGETSQLEVSCRESQALGPGWHIQPSPSCLMSPLQPGEKGSQVPSFLVIRLTIKPLGNLFPLKTVRVFCCFRPSLYQQLGQGNP